MKRRNFLEKLITEGVFRDSPLVVLDVGARKGVESHWRKYGDQVVCVGFEPEGKSFIECATKRSARNIKYYQVALDRSAKVRPFFISAYPSASSFLLPNDTVISKYGLNNAVRVVETIDVETIDLDSFVLKEKLPKVDFIKLDTEGTELDILKGAEEVLRNSVLGVSVEVCFEKLKEGQSLFSDVDLFLTQRGFSLYDLALNRWSRKDWPKSEKTIVGTQVGQLVFAQALYLRNAVEEIRGNLPNRQTEKPFETHEATTSPREDARKKAMGSVNIADSETGTKSRIIWDRLKLLKMASLMELFLLPDCALELVKLGLQWGYLDNKSDKWLENILLAQARLSPLRRIVAAGKKRLLAMDRGKPALKS